MIHLPRTNEPKPITAHELIRVPKNAFFPRFMAYLRSGINGLNILVNMPQSPLPFGHMPPSGKREHAYHAGKSEDQ